MKLGILIASYNRPEYLRQCLESVKRADLSQVYAVLIVDDASTDPETIRLINEFELDGVELIKVFSKENRSIKGTMMYGCDLLFNTCDVVTNLDGDALITADGFNRLLELREQFPGHILTGFNCSTKNRNGTVRHKILEQGEGWNKKFSVGGINMMFGENEYRQIIRPALEKCIKKGGNWDHQACIISNEGYGRPIVVLEPSCVQHIGVEVSSMGHMAGGEPPDVAEDFVGEYYVYSNGYWTTSEMQKDIREWEKKLKEQQLRSFGEAMKVQLPDVTLVAADCVNLERIFKAADKCTDKIKFGAVKIFSALTTTEKKRKVIPINPITSKEAYSWWIMKDLAGHIKTSHLLIFQYDGYVLNPSAWKDEWLQYDYIGAPWEWYDSNKVGNGGFSLRSKKLMDAVANDPDLFPTTDGLNTHKEEDHCICRIYRKYLEDNYDIKFAPLEVAREFSIEGWRSKNRTWTNEFGFHGHGLTNIKP